MKFNIGDKVRILSKSVGMAMKDSNIAQIGIGRVADYRIRTTKTFGWWLIIETDHIVMEISFLKVIWKKRKKIS
jgi:hypothetical protein